MTDIVAYLNFYILIANVIIMVIMSVFLHRHKDLKGHLYMLEVVQDKLRQRMKECENAIGIFDHRIGELQGDDEELTATMKKLAQALGHDAENLSLHPTAKYQGIFKKPESERET